MRTQRRITERRQIQKACGADVELANFIQGRRNVAGRGTGFEASRLLLSHMPGVRAHSAFGSGWTSGDNPQDWGRKYLASNGGCSYVDLDHLELCIPEVVSAFDHVASSHAMLRIARSALRSANETLPEGESLKVIVNTSDGHGHSYGSHISFLLTRRAYENLFRDKPHHLLFLASFLASGIVLWGSGKVGSENRRQPVDFQISQRADFIECLTGPQTTDHRPLVNSRDESLADDQTMARLHLINFDSTLAHVASLLKVGTTQIVLAMIEQEWFSPRLVLDDAVLSIRRFSHDPNLRQEERLITGRAVTAVELQIGFFNLARRFVQSGGIDGIVPRGEEILGRWEETLRLLQNEDFAALTGRLDWVLKRSLLQRAQQELGLSWAAPEIAHLDQAYADLDPSCGLFWTYEDSLDRVVSDDDVHRFVEEPPDDTRAWTRAHLLRRAQEDPVTSLDWDHIEFRRPAPFGRLYRRLDMRNPLASNRASHAAAFRDDPPLDDLLDALGATGGGG